MHGHEIFRTWGGQILEEVDKAKHVMYVEALDHLCLRMHWKLYTIVTSIPLLVTG